jgi:hypothetical protein
MVHGYDIKTTKLSTWHSICGHTEITVFSVQSNSKEIKFPSVNKQNCKWCPKF